MEIHVYEDKYGGLCTIEGVVQKFSRKWHPHSWGNVDDALILVLITEDNKPVVMLGADEKELTGARVDDIPKSALVLLDLAEKIMAACFEHRTGRQLPEPPRVHSEIRRHVKFLVEEWNVKY